MRQVSPSFHCGGVSLNLELTGSARPADQQAPGSPCLPPRNRSQASSTTSVFLWARGTTEDSVLLSLGPVTVLVSYVFKNRELTFLFRFISFLAQLYTQLGT